MNRDRHYFYSGCGQLENPRPHFLSERRFHSEEGKERRGGGSRSWPTSRGLAKKKLKLSSPVGLNTPRATHPSSSPALSSPFELASRVFSNKLSLRQPSLNSPETLRSKRRETGEDGSSSWNASDEGKEGKRKKEVNRGASRVVIARLNSANEPRACLSMPTYDSGFRVQTFCHRSPPGLRTRFATIGAVRSLSPLIADQPRRDFSRFFAMTL